MTDNRFFGLSQQEREFVLKSFQEGLVAAMMLEQQIESGAITEDLLGDSYQRAVEQDLVSPELLPFDAYRDCCHSDLALYIALSRAIFAGDDEALAVYGGDLSAANQRNRIADSYYFLIRELTKHSIEDAEITGQNVRHILSGRKDR